MYLSTHTLPANNTTQPCVDLWNVLNDALESFIASALLSVPLDRMGGGRVSRPPQELDDDAVENKVRFTLKVSVVLFLLFMHFE